MFSSEREGVGTDSLIQELKRLRTENYGLIRALEKETLARKRVEIDLRMLQMEVEDKTEKQQAWVKTEAGNFLPGYNLLGPSNMSSPINPTLSPKKANHSPSYSEKVISSPPDSELLVNFSASTPCPKTTNASDNFYDLNHNVTVIKDFKQMPALERNVEGKCVDKKGRPASKRSKNAKKRARESGGLGDTQMSENSSLDERKRRYVFCQHCKIVRYLLPIIDKKGRSQAFRHTCKTPSGTKRAQQTLKHKSSTCKETHAGPCLRLATIDEIDQVFVLLNDGGGEVDIPLTPISKLNDPDTS